MSPESTVRKERDMLSHLENKLKHYGRADTKKALWQLFNTFIPYAALFGASIYMLNRNYAWWYILPLIIPAAALLVRIFIFFHDCCHASFFASQRANRILGYISGILTFTPYDEWRSAHNTHHATAGDLDRRGTGDVWTMTVDEYTASSGFRKFVYRFYRNPIVMFGLGPIFVFLIVNRFHSKKTGSRERMSVIITNVSLLLIALAAWQFGILGEYLLVQLPIMFIAGIFGIWLFYVQHQYEDVYWSRHDKWDRVRAALEGSSYYKLPKILQWFSGNIGLHHIHHIRPRIPNYNLQQCYDDITEFQSVRPLTLGRSMKSLFMNLWDEKKRKMVGFHSL